MEENKSVPVSGQEERTYTASEVNAIVSQYKIQFEQLKKSAAAEIEKRDLGNFYQMLSVIFEIVRNKDAYPGDFVNKCIGVVTSSVSSMLDVKKDEKDGE